MILLWHPVPTKFLKRAKRLLALKAHLQTAGII